MAGPPVIVRFLSVNTLLLAHHRSHRDLEQEVREERVAVGIGGQKHWFQFPVARLYPLCCSLISDVMSPLRRLIASCRRGAEAYMNAQLSQLFFFTILTLISHFETQFLIGPTLPSISVHDALLEENSTSKIGLSAVARL